MSQQTTHTQSRARRTRSTTGAAIATAALAYGAYRFYDWYCADEEEKQTTEGGEESPSLLSTLWGNYLASDSRSSQLGGPTTHSPPLDARTLHRLRRQRLQKCRLETTKAVSQCWKEIQPILDNATNTSVETKALKSLRKSQHKNLDREEALWMALHEKTLTRVLATVYAHSLLLLSLTMQLNWVSGSIFRRQQQRRVVDAEPANVERLLLVTQRYFVQQGAPLLLQWIHTVINESPCRAYAASHLLSSLELATLLEELRNGMKYGNRSVNSRGNSIDDKAKYPRNWGRLILPDVDGSFENSDESSSINSCLDDWWDVVASPAWEDAFDQVLRSSFNGLLRDVTSPSSLPWTKCLSMMKTQATSLVSTALNEENGTATNTAVQSLQQLPTVLELGDVSFQ